MGKVNYAAIDIGSNAVRLLIKSIDREAVQEKKIKKVMMLQMCIRDRWYGRMMTNLFK